LPWVIGIILLFAGIAVVHYYLRFIAPFETTDDAFVEGHVAIVSPRVPGQVVRLLVQDNQEVKQGDVLLEIDPADYDTKVAQLRADLASAKSQLEQTKAQTAVDEAKVEQQRAAVLAAEAEAGRAEADLKRYESVESRAVSRSQLDLARAQAKASTAQLEVARSQTKAAEAQVVLSHANTQTASAAVGQAEAKLRQAELDLSYTKIVAPVSGRVTRRTVEQGDYVQTSQSLLALVPDQLWVVANFKETQLTHMRPGQPVQLYIDAYPGRVLTGKVDSIQAGTGARFSLLPPENAVGNYVKVVQRLPVKILFDPPPDAELALAPGMSVVPEVRVK
jgi:membrane fusion protein (multidrug efflux system)